MDVRDIIIAMGVVAAIWAIVSAVAMVAIYWTHNPYGQKRRRK